MPELFRTRDLVVLVKGLSFPVAAHSSLLATGWPGGQGLMWVDSTRDEHMVRISDGQRGAGFALWGSNEDSDVLTAITGQQLTYGHLVLCFGTWIFATRVYEKYTYASRQIPPLVEITYTESEPLYWSLRGLFTNEDEWTLSGDPRAPNTFSVGYVAKEPVNGYLAVHTSI